MNEGYIKFNCFLQDANSGLSEEYFLLLTEWRDKLYHIKLLGCYPGGIGYGNISVRMGSGFIITGSATGCKDILTKDDYARVDRYDFNKNEIYCTGRISASSESLTHAAVYEARPEVMAVIHIHSIGLWEKYRGIMPATPEAAGYGTPEIARAVRSLCMGNNIKGNDIIIMGGHKEGIISFGKNLNAAGKKILDLLN